MSLASALRRRVASLTLPQAARLAEGAARRRAPGREVGGDTPPRDEPLRFVASDRMTLVAGDIADIGEVDGRLHVTANLLGLAGAAPALPPVYSEVQLQRRRLRDRSLAGFLNIFDHRALSFFYRAFRKYHWLVGFEREAAPGGDPVSRAMLALAGLGGASGRLSFAEAALAPFAGRLADRRPTAAALAAMLRRVSGLDVRIGEAEPAWLAVPPAEQTRLGGGFARLGGVDPVTGLGALDAAMAGASVLDVQYRYSVEIGPLSHAELLRFCAPDGPRARIEEVCLLVAGLERQPLIRLTIRAGDIPPLRLGEPAAPALLGRTGWLGAPGPAEQIATDCEIVVERR